MAGYGVRRARLVAALFWFASCHAGGFGRALTIVVPSAPIGLFPNTVNEDITLSILSNVYEALVDLDPLLQLHPGLAESWYSADDTTWIFRLRKDVRLHDGRTLTAQDVATSLNHAVRDPNSRRAVQLTAVQDVTAAGDTVIVRTKWAFAALPMRLANVFVWSAARGGQPEGTGPYRLVSSTAEQTVLDAFDDYRVRVTSIHRIIFRVVPEIGERARLVQTSEADFMIDVPAERVDHFREKVHVQAVKGLRVFLLGLSCQPESGNPFADVRVRRALSLGIDRGSLVAPAGGYAQPVDQIVSPEELGGHHTSVAVRKYDPAEARKILAEAGYPKGFETDLYLSVKYRNTGILLDELVKQLALVGILVHPRVIKAEEYFRRLEERDMPMYLLGWVSDTGDGRVSYDYLLHSRSGLLGLDNGEGYSNPAADALIEKASRTNAQDALGAIFEKLERQVADDVPIIPLFRQDDVYAFSSDLIYTPRIDRRLRFETARWR